MRSSLQPQPGRATPVAWYLSGDAMRSRSVSDVALLGVVDVPEPSVRLRADWRRESSLLDLGPGDVEVLPLARVRVRWPDYKTCVQAVADWTRSLGLPDVLASSEVALMTSRGARYHHDGAQYGGAAFCNLFLSDDQGLDLHFSATGQRIPLVRGTVVIFDTGQPHAVIDRRRGGFDAADFTLAQDRTQVFLTWELSIENPDMVRALQIVFDVEASSPLPIQVEEIRVNGEPAHVCPASGRWCLEG